MLDWLKRTKANAPGERSVENENQIPSTEEKVERLVERLGGGRKQADDAAPDSSGQAEAVPVTQIGPVPGVHPVFPLAPMPAAEPEAEAAPVVESTPALDTELAAETALASEAAVPALDMAPAAPTAPPPPEVVPVAEVVPIDAPAAAPVLTPGSEPVLASEVLSMPEIIRPSEAPRATAPTRVIAVAAQKGGAGKTTITAHLAVQASALGQGPVVLADTDPQGSLSQWWRARNDDTLALAAARLEEIATNPALLRSRGAAIAFIDTPPALTGSIEQIIAISDLIIIPARPSPHDLRAVGATVEMTRRAGKPFLFVVNGAAPRANITAEAVAALSEHGRVAPVILYQRTDYAASMIDGRTVMETAAGGRSAQEMSDLWSYVYAQISVRAAA
jgi:chromosome partitioning protein